MVDINKALLQAVRTGKVTFGLKRAIETLTTGRSKLVILASNCPQHAAEKIATLSKASEIPTYVYKDSSIDLGVACGTPYTVAALSITDPGESAILSAVKQKSVQ